MDKIISKFSAPVTSIEIVDSKTVKQITTSVAFDGTKTIVEKTVNKEEFNANIDKQIAFLEAKKIK